MRRLVITADDLGRDPDTDRGIAELAADGLITATTAIVVSPHAADAVASVVRAGLVPRVHVTLSSERGVPPWHPLTEGSSLVDGDGALPLDPSSVARDGVPDEVAAELEAQWSWFAERGISAPALDSHAGTLYGLTGRSFVGEALALCARHGMGFRLPRDPATYFGAGLPPEVARPHAMAVEAADAAGVPLPAAMITNRLGAAELGTFEALREQTLRQLAALPEGTSELFLHPAPEGALDGPDGRTRTWELRLLRDDVFRAALATEELELVGAW